MSRGRGPEVVDDLMGEAHERADNIMHHWQEGFRDEDSWLLYNLKWYFWKYMNRLERRESKHREAREDLGRSEDIESAVQVRALLSTLEHPLDRILEGIFLEDMTCKEMADELGMARHTVRKYRDRALAQLRLLEGGG